MCAIHAMLCCVEQTSFNTQSQCCTFLFYTFSFLFFSCCEWRKSKLLLLFKKNNDWNWNVSCVAIEIQIYFIAPYRIMSWHASQRESHGENESDQCVCVCEYDNIRNVFITVFSLPPLISINECKVICTQINCCLSEVSYCAFSALHLDKKKV